MSLTYDETKFSAAQVAEFKASAISPAMVEAAGVFSESDAKAASKLLGRPPKYWDGHLPVTIYPYFLPFSPRDPFRYRGKPARPFEMRRDDGSVTSAKYVEPKGSHVHLYFGPSLLSGCALKDTSIELWITEGEKKALAAESVGLSCIAISGVHQWHEKGSKTLHPDFAHVALEGRKVRMAFDRDALANKAVRDQELALSRALKSRGALVTIVRFTEDAPKLDDWLATHELSELSGLIADAEKNGQVSDELKVAGVPEPATEMTDLANAERFRVMHGDSLRYCKQNDTWYAWTGARWQPDADDLVVRRAYRTVRKIYEEADGIADSDMRNAMRQHARRSESSGRVTALIKMAGALMKFAVRVDQFDADPWLLNCENGTVDLRTGELRPHNPSDMITRLAPVHFDPDATHPRWAAFLAHVTDDNSEISDFLARAVGYSLTGDTREDRLFFIFGPPARGKSTFVGAIEATLGDYARTADISTFVQSSHGPVGGDKPRPDLVRLIGARICVCKELDQGVKLAEGLVKSITGGDTITVRDLHAKPIEIRPSFKLWLVANDPPAIRGDDAGMWRRILRIPFTRELSGQVQTGFREALQEPEMRAAVLAWAVRGSQLWLNSGGLTVPEAVERSTAEYQTEMDPVGEFFDKQCVWGRDEKVPRKALRKAYEEWCSDVGHLAVGARRFAAALRERIRVLGFGTGQADIETNMHVDDKWVDGWRCVRLLTDYERAGERAWGKRPEVHVGGAGSWGVGGQKGPKQADSLFPTGSRQNIKTSTAGPIYSNPQDPQDPQKKRKEKEDQGKPEGVNEGGSGEQPDDKGIKTW